MSHFFCPIFSGPARVEFGTGNRRVPFFGPCPRRVRNWKQACPFFFRVARVEFRVKFRVEATKPSTKPPASLKKMTYKKCPSLQSGSRSRARNLLAQRRRNAVKQLARLPPDPLTLTPHESRPPLSAPQTPPILPRVAPAAAPA